MYSYVLLANLEENFLKQTVISLDKEGYVPLKSRGDWLIMRKGDDGFRTVIFNRRVTRGIFDHARFLETRFFYWIIRTNKTRRFNR